MRAIHEDIVKDQPDSEQGVRTPAAVDSVIERVSVGYFGRVPETIHESAATMLRLLVADHPFVDGNKRTALNTVVVFYELNHYGLPYDDERMRSLLKRFGVDAEGVLLDETIEYLRSTAAPLGDVHTAEEANKRRDILTIIRATSETERLEAVRRLAALDRERNAVTYNKLATE